MKAPAQTANQAPSEDGAAAGKDGYSRAAVLLVVLTLALLGMLFAFLLKWSHRLDQASYLGKVYQESVEDFEYKRLATVPTTRLQTQEYQFDISRDPEWLNIHRRPEPPAGMKYRYMSSDGFGGTTLPPGVAASTPADAAKEDEFREKDWEWREEVNAEAQKRYRADLAQAREEAEKRAKLASDVDLSVLRGRGAEFVLEFTTIVVIIFAALILGILGILGSEQIGTLLAAIAGYVLGRATTRSRGGPSESAGAPLGGTGVADGRENGQQRGSPAGDRTGALSTAGRT